MAVTLGRDMVDLQLAFTKAKLVVKKVKELLPDLVQLIKDLLGDFEDQAGDDLSSAFVMQIKITLAEEVIKLFFSQIRGSLNIRK